jgi:hypothetical protein
MKPQKPAMIGIAVILVIALLLVPVAAKTASGNVKVENHEQNSVQDNSVKAEKTVHVELSGDASYHDEASDPIDLTSNDGTLHVVVDADITAQGKTTGTGSAILDGSVIAQGSHDPGNTSAVINTSVTSSAVLDSGTKGKAEGKVFSSGNASATFDDGCKELTSNVSGSSSANGKTQSASVGLLNASSGIWSESAFDPLNTSAEALIYSYVYGENTSSGTACASGSADASADNGNVIASVTGTTKAGGSGSGSGGFDANAEISAESEVGQSIWGYVESLIYSDSSVWNGCGKYTGTASSSASTPIGEENTAYYVGGPSLTNVLGANTTGTAKSDAAMNNGMGIAYSQSGILASAAAPSTISPVLEFGPKSLGFGLVFIPVYEDRSIIWNDVFTSGNGDKSKVSASGWAGGEADAMLTYQTPPGFPMSGVYTSNTSAEGDTSAKAKVEGCGVAGADSLIGSFDLIGVDGYGSVSLWEGIPGGDNFELPDTTALTDNQGFDALQFPALDINGYLPSDTSFVDQLQGPIIFELPPIDVLEISIISQSVYAESGYKSKASAGACADGDTAAEGVSFLTEPISILAQGNTSASGFVAGGAEASSPKKETADSESASVILGVSAQGIGIPFAGYTTTQDGNEISGLDATLIASTSGASGPSGKTWGVASGDANASGGFGPEFDFVGGPSSTSGTAESSATANCGLGLSTAAIGSADYATDELYFTGVVATGVGALDPSLVDVALIGSGAFSAGTAGAHASVDGITEANGSILHEYIGDLDPVETLLNITSDAFANGEVCSDVSTRNGVALAADAILSGEGTFINFDDGNVSAGETAGSIVGQAAFAQQFGKSGSAKADTYAMGEAGTTSTYYSDLGLGRYFSADGTTDATGTVSGNANAGCGDPLSVSAIVAFNDFGGSLDEAFAGIGHAYNAALVSSLSASSGKSADTWGSANGTAFAGSTQVLNTTPAGDSLYVTNSTSSADATVKTTASTTSMNGFALGVAAQGASSESDSAIDDVDIGGGHAITLDGAFSVADDNGKATAFVNMQEQVCKDKKGKVREIVLVPVEGREAAALAQFTADLDDDLVPDGNFTSTSVSGSHAITSAEAAKGGFGLSLAGEASGSLTDVNSTTGILDQDVFSVIAGLAVAETDCSKETAKANAEAGGETAALNYAQIPGWNGTQSSQAQGRVSAGASAGEICRDPLAASLILAIGENEVYPDPYLLYIPAMDTSDSTLIASFAATNGTKGEAGASACGSADADGVQLVPQYYLTLTPLSPTASASTDASVWSHVAGNKGEGVGVAGVGSSSDAHVDFNLEYVQDQNLMFSYTTGQGFGKKATVEAFAGYDAAHTAASASNVFDRDLEVPKVESNSSVAGIGNSFVKASDYSKAQALSFGWAGQNASVDFTLYPGDVGNASHADATVLFGTEANATDNAKGTLAKAEMCQVNLEANARAGFSDFSIPEEYSSAKVIDGNSHVFLDPYYLNGFVDWDTVFTPDTSVSPGGSKTNGITEAGDLGVDPNYWYTHGGAWANSDVSPAPDPWPPYDMILSHIPV